MTIEAQIKMAYGTALAVLQNKLQDVNLAEDALQHACLLAIEKWPLSPPNSAKAWLIRVGYNYAIDGFRKAKPLIYQIQEKSSEIDLAYQFEDAILGLIFTCCHPAISTGNQLAITLKLVMGFYNKEISRALLLPVKTIEQRITRTKRKIIDNQLDFELPSSRHLPVRLPAVLKVLYLLFNEGYHTSNGDELLSTSLCNQAIKLIRSLSRLYRGQAQIIALLSLMLFSSARMPARSLYRVITLEEQDRSKWDRNLIAQADILLQKSLKMGEVNQYHIEAAISGLHSLSNNYLATDWPQIAALYDKLLTFHDSPVVLLNQAVALIMAGSYLIAEQKLRLIGNALTTYPPYYLVWALLSEHINDHQAVIKHYQTAMTLSQNQIEKDFIRNKLANVELAYRNTTH